MDKECCFCETEKKFAEYTRPALQLINREIAQTESLKVYSCISPLNNGHIMVIPKRHILSIGECTDAEREEFTVIINQVREYNKAKHGIDTNGFEHGTSSCLIGGCVAHAHLHLITAEDEQVKYFFNKKLHLVPTTLNGLKNIKMSDYGYFLFLDKDSNLFVDNSTILPSQYGRQVFGIFNNREWNWKEGVLQYPEKLVKNIEITKEHYKGLKDYIK